MKSRPIFWYFLAISIALVFSSCGMIVRIPSGKTLECFFFVNPPANGTIDQEKKTISVTVPNAINAQGLVASFKTAGERVTVGSTPQISGVTPNDFTTPVIYTVTATNGSSVDYTVTLNYAPIKTVWARSTLSGAGVSAYKSVAVDSKGNAYAAGYIYGNMEYDFGNNVKAKGPSNGMNGILVMYNSRGVAQWARTAIAGSADSSFSAISIDSQGNILVAGSIFGNSILDFGNSVLVSGKLTTNNRNILIVKYNSAGIAQWARSINAGTSNSNFSSITSDIDGNIYVAGTINGSGRFDMGDSVFAQAQYTGGENAIIVSYDSSGNTRWARTVFGLDQSSYSGISIDRKKNLYAAGTISGNNQFAFGSGVTATGKNAGGVNALLIKYSESGIPKWARTINEGPTRSYYTSIDVDRYGNIYTAGVIDQGLFNFGNSVTAFGEYLTYNTILVKFDVDGVAVWARPVYIASSASAFYSVCVDSQNEILVAGDIRDMEQYVFGDQASVHGNYMGLNPLLIKYNQFGTALFARSLYFGSSDSSFRAISVDNGGAIFAVGEIYGTSQFDFGDSITISGTSPANTNTVIVKYN